MNKQIHIRISELKHKKLKILAAESNKSLNHLVGLAISILLANNKNVSKET
jgi:predicted HicB family RNase H-like nuclease